MFHVKIRPGSSFNQAVKGLVSQAKKQVVIGKKV
jgi:hypothetical protein